jgi:hypothetical protein
MVHEHRKTGLTTRDIEFKKLLNDTIKEHIRQAANALETTRFEKSIRGEDAIGNRRSAVGVLMSVLGWDGGISASSKYTEEVIKMEDHSAEKDAENRTIFRRKVADFLSEYIVGRITFLCTYYHCSFDEIAQWLRSLLDN